MKISDKIGNNYCPHELKTRLIDEWVQFDQSIVAAIDQWRRHLSACVHVIYMGHTASTNYDNFEPICHAN